MFVLSLSLSSMAMAVVWHGNDMTSFATATNVFQFVFVVDADVCGGVRWSVVNTDVFLEVIVVGKSQDRPIPI